MAYLRTVKNTVYNPENLIHRMCVYNIYFMYIIYTYNTLSTNCDFTIFGASTNKTHKRCESTKLTSINVTFPACPPPYFKLCLKSDLLF